MQPPTPMPDFLTIAFIGLAALGLSLFWRGWRGRRIDNHPWCSKCRFDLNGVWPGAARCPECGVDLQRIDAVELGQRHRRPLLTALGAILLLCCAVWVGLGVWRSTGSINWADYKPDWWLVREACTGDAEVSQTAATALRERISKGTVSDAHVAALVERALEVQGDEAAAWSDAWGEIILNAWIDGRLTPDQSLQFAQRAVTFTLDPGGPLVRQWEFATLSLQPTPLRAAVGQCTVRLIPQEAFIGDDPLLLDPTDITEMGVRLRAGSFGDSHSVPITVEPGEYVIRAGFTVEMSPNNSTIAPAAWDIRLSAPLKVLPHAEDAAELVIGAPADEMLLGAFDFQAVGLRLNTTAQGRTRSVIILFAQVDEAPISADVSLSASTGPMGPGRGTRVQTVFASGRSITAPMLIGRSYRLRWEITGQDDSTAKLTIRIAPQMRRSSRSGASPWVSQKIWYGLPLETAPIPVQWYDSIDDPNLPEALRERCREPDGWRSVSPPVEGEKAQP